MGPGANNAVSGLAQPSVLRPSRDSLAPGLVSQQPPPSVMRTLKRPERDTLATPAANRGWNNNSNQGFGGEGLMSQARNNLFSKLTAHTPVNRQSR